MRHAVASRTAGVVRRRKSSASGWSRTWNSYVCGPFTIYALVDKCLQGRRSATEPFNLSHVSAQHAISLAIPIIISLGILTVLSIKTKMPDDGHEDDEDLDREDNTVTPNLVAGPSEIENIVE